MAGVDFSLLGASAMFLFAIWFIGRVFKACKLPAILGYLVAGVLLGPECLDVVPYASDGYCSGVIFKDVAPPAGGSSAVAVASSSSSASDARRLLETGGSGSGHDCKAIFTFNNEHVQDIWSFAGTIGVTLLIMESGMHINFEKVAQIGGKALVVAIIGTALPMVVGMALVFGFFPSMHFYNAFAAGCALAPTSVGISINLLSDAKMLNSIAGQTTLTAAFIDDVFSLVLLVLLSSLANGNADPGIIVLRTLVAFAFLGLGALLAKRVCPKLERLLERIPLKPSASIQPRDEAHLAIMVGALVLFSYLGSLIGSHLLGSFVAGMCFVEVPRSHTVWVDQFKRVIRWLVRVFFAATVGFAIPLQQMVEPAAITKGFAFGVAPGILCKVISGVAARAHANAREVRLMSEASFWTRGGVVQPIQYLVGMAMVARGEFAFLVAYSATKMTNPDAPGEAMLESDVYAAVIWGLVWALIFAPFLFKWALGVYGRAAPVQRGMSIGGSGMQGASFVIKVYGAHHAGMLREMLNAIHAEGMDVLEATAETDGAVDCDQFTVQSRGKQKDFDDEKLDDIRHHIQEVVGDKNVVVEFGEVEETAAHELVAVEVQVVAERSAATFATATERLESLHLDVLEASKTHRLQLVHGHEKTLDHNTFYLVPRGGDEGLVISSATAGVVKAMMTEMLGKLNLKGEVLAKAITSRAHGFAALKDFDATRAAERVSGVLWLVLVMGPHEVERLGAACRALSPADEATGIRVVHVAHSHRGSRPVTRLLLEQTTGTAPPSTPSDEEQTKTRVELAATLTRVYALEGVEGATVRVTPLLSKEALAGSLSNIPPASIPERESQEAIDLGDGDEGATGVGLGMLGMLGRLPGTPPPPEGIAISTTSVAHGGASLPSPEGGAAKQRRSSLGLQMELLTGVAPPAAPSLSSSRASSMKSAKSAKPYSIKVSPTVEELAQRVDKLEGELRGYRQADADRSTSSLGLPLNDSAVAHVTSPQADPNKGSGKIKGAEA